MSAACWLSKQGHPQCVLSSWGLLCNPVSVFFLWGCCGLPLFRVIPCALGILSLAVPQPQGLSCVL